MILGLAFKNVLKHRRHTFLLAFLIMLITALFYIGNSVIAESERGLRRSYVENYTGDMVVHAQSDVPMSLFGTTVPTLGDFFTIPTLKEHDQILSLTENDPDVKAVTSQLTAAAMLKVASRYYPVPVFGVDAGSYFDVFPGIELRRGSFLKPGETGAMISVRFAERIEKESGKPLALGTKMLLNTIGRVGFKIRPVPLIGVFAYRASSGTLSEIVLADAPTIRALNSVLITPGPAHNLSRESTDILTDDVDNLFETRLKQAAKPAPARVSLAELHTLVAAQNGSDASNSGGSWNFIIIRLKPGIGGNSAVDRLKKTLAAYPIELTDWRGAAGTPALLSLLLGILFNSGFALVFAAGIIGIVNILLITVFGRTRDIGTLRAMGASNSYIRTLILAENLIISLAGGGLGVALGNTFLSLVNSARLHIHNELIAALFGGNVFTVGSSPTLAMLSVAIAAGLGLLASVYPLHVALRIEPIDAISKG